MHRSVREHFLVIFVKVRTVELQVLHSDGFQLARLRVFNLSNQSDLVLCHWFREGDNVGFLSLGPEFLWNNNSTGWSVFIQDVPTMFNVTGHLTDVPLLLALGYYDTVANKVFQFGEIGWNGTFTVKIIIYLWSNEGRLSVILKLFEVWQSVLWDVLDVQSESGTSLG
ncbi:hypothetical protein WICPIJ_009156 [Wickerhamomyces pijperi]|uniref:Uncharacterized protein n=1 Tax=Wickerhamomyces pijperi TaxID=599730 RepID=A0A9P8TFB7_WICPI|nr:hypothetical protein WICPIJ_009156 [Wickerhamomyces pijperi]